LRLTGENGSVRRLCPSGRQRRVRPTCALASAACRFGRSRPGRRGRGPHGVARSFRVRGRGCSARLAQAHPVSRLWRLVGIPRSPCGMLRETSRDSRRLSLPFRALDPTSPRHRFDRVARLAPVATAASCSSPPERFWLYSACNWKDPCRPGGQAACERTGSATFPPGARS
jgi:hypothetical protein